MKLVVGLGNPGRKYERTRHNVGFMAVEDLAKALHAGPWKGESRAEIARATLDGESVLLAKPQTFMNDSGQSVRALAGFYKLAPAEILVIADDLDLPFGTLRIRPNGSAGGHNGLKSIIADLGTQDFPRLRIGIGRPARGETIDYVLAPFDEAGRGELPLILAPAVDAALAALRIGVLAAMNEHNGRGDLRLPPPPPKPPRAVLRTLDERPRADDAPTGDRRTVYLTSHGSDDGTVAGRSIASVQGDDEPTQPARQGGGAWPEVIERVVGDSDPARFGHPRNQSETKRVADRLSRAGKVTADG